MSNIEKRIAFFLPNLNGGGAEKSIVNLVKEFSKRNFYIDLVLVSAQGPYISQIPNNVRIIDLNTSHVILALPKLVKYLASNKPDALISSLNHANVVAIMAKLILNSKTKIIVREDSIPSQERRNSKSIKSKVLPLLMHVFYPYADFVIAVSKGVKEDLVSYVRLKPGRIKVIFNPVLDLEIFDRAKENVDYKWFNDNNYLPIIISVGRLTEPKDFGTLLKAFALVRKQIDARLVILGEGEERKNLETLTKELGVSDYVWMPGFVDNPYKYMSRADVFVLSSLYEGLSMVLIEALALGVPVISTDCKSGPREVLENGKYGKLVPVHDVNALSTAIMEVLTNPKSFEIDKDVLEKYKSEKIFEEYLKLI
ncbi:glycosyltransferase [Caldisericum exile]|uniref:Glycosyltransferase n=1 Tax=Caldisericum exile (strain DSM 21853 / NBRC 104410 / AZM16c01) TaxID=511051 RepID=A0A7U6GFY7_CALEA|nr:glycosyltransferase [Caldisericum exile]BAL81659.1 putative glycosyltransferase [Caldisericum exile AZM16c01]